MGGGGQTSSVAGPNPVTQPAFQGASQAVQDVQQRLPMTMFTNWNPQLTAGIAPLQQAAMQAAVAGMQAPSGLDSLMRMQNPLAMIAANQFDMARANPMMEQIMGRLGFSGGGSQAPMNTGADLASQIPGAPQASLYNMPPIDPSLITSPVPLMQSNPPVDNMYASNLRDRTNLLQAQLDAGLYGSGGYHGPS